MDDPKYVELVDRTRALEPGDLFGYVELELDWLLYKYPEMDKEFLSIMRSVISDAWTNGHQHGLDRGFAVASGSLDESI